MLRNQRKRLFGAIFLHRNRRLRVQRVGRLLERRAAVIHAELAVGRRVPDVAVVGENRVLHSHQAEDALDLTNIADRIAVEAANEVDLLIGLALQLRRGSGLAVPEMLENPLHHIVVAGDVAADESGRVSERNVIFCRHGPFFLRCLDEGVQVVADHFRHAGRGDGNHLRLVHVVGIGETVDHVVEAAEHRGVLGHRGGDAGTRLLEVPREMAAIIGDAAL